MNFLQPWGSLSKTVYILLSEKGGVATHLLQVFEYFLFPSFCNYNSSLSFPNSLLAALFSCTRS